MLPLQKWFSLFTLENTLMAGRCDQENQFGGGNQFFNGYNSSYFYPSPWQWDLSVPPSQMLSICLPPWMWAGLVFYFYQQNEADIMQRDSSTA